VIPDDPRTTTYEQVVGAPAPLRPRMVEAYLLASVRALRPDADERSVGPDTQLSDLAIDSIQVVELKFGLDQVVGTELDAELVITNPTIRELAERSVVAAGLA
jgi:acyl carrier protein